MNSKVKNGNMKIFVHILIAFLIYHVNSSFVRTSSLNGSSMKVENRGTSKRYLAVEEYAECADILV